MALDLDARATWFGYRTTGRALWIAIRLRRSLAPSAKLAGHYVARRERRRRAGGWRYRSPGPAVTRARSRRNTDRHLLGSGDFSARRPCRRDDRRDPGQRRRRSTCALAGDGTVTCSVALDSTTASDPAAPTDRRDRGQRRPAAVHVRALEATTRRLLGRQRSPGRRSCPPRIERCDPDERQASSQISVRAPRRRDTRLPGNDSYGAGDDAAGTDRASTQISAGLRRPTRARSRATGPSPAGARTTTGRRPCRRDARMWSRSAPGRQHVRGQARRHRHLLGRTTPSGRATVPAGTSRASPRSAPAAAIRARSEGRDGTVTCWGADSAMGQRAVPRRLTGVTQVGAGGGDACALKGDGTVTCWGDDQRAGDRAGRVDRASPRSAPAAPYVRASGRRYRHLLGLRRRRAGDRAARADGRRADQRRRVPHVRAQARRHGDLLGLRRRGQATVPPEWRASRRSAPGAGIRARSRTTAPSPVGATTATGRRPCRRDYGCHQVSAGDCTRARSRATAP